MVPSLSDLAVDDSYGGFGGVVVVGLWGVLWLDSFLFGRLVVWARRGNAGAGGADAQAAQPERALRAPAAWGGEVAHRYQSLCSPWTRSVRRSIRVRQVWRWRAEADRGPARSQGLRATEARATARYQGIRCLLSAATQPALDLRRCPGCNRSMTDCDEVRERPSAAGGHDRDLRVP